MQRAAIRAMPPADRIRLVLDLCDDVRRITLDGIRSRHPDAMEGELVALLVDHWHGPDSGDQVRRALGRARS